MARQIVVAFVQKKSGNEKCRIYQNAEYEHGELSEYSKATKKLHNFSDTNDQGRSCFNLTDRLTSFFW